jgi:hypothetical protein
MAILRTFGNALVAYITLSTARLVLFSPISIVAAPQDEPAATVRSLRVLWTRHDLDNEKKRQELEAQVFKQFGTVLDKHGREMEVTVRRQKFTHALEAVQAGNMKLQYIPGEPNASISDYIVPLWAILSRVIKGDQYNCLVVVSAGPGEAATSYSQFAPDIYSAFGLTHSLLPRIVNPQASLDQIQSSIVVYSDVQTIVGLKSRADQEGGGPYRRVYETLITRVSLLQLFE